MVALSYSKKKTSKDAHAEEKNDYGVIGDGETLVAKITALGRRPSTAPSVEMGAISASLRTRRQY